MQLSKFGKIIAAGTLATVLCGATVGFATTLADYPSPFVSDGTVSSLIVVGAKADPADVVGAIDIAARLGGEPGETKTVTCPACPGTAAAETLSGEGKAIATSNTKIYVGDALNKDGVRTTMTATDLPTILAGGTVDDTDASTTYDYSQYIVMGGKTVTLDDDSELDYPTLMVKIGTTGTDYLYDAKVVFEKEMNVTSAENEEIKLFGKTYTIASDSVFDDSNAKLVLYGSANTQLVDEGASATVTIDGVDHTVTVNGVSDTDVAVITVDGTTKEVTEGKSYTIAGVTVYIDGVYYYSKAAQTSQVKLSIGSQIVTLKDGSEVMTGSSDTKIKGTKVAITKGDTNDTLSILEVKVAAQDSTGDFLKLGGEFVDPVFGTFKVAFPSATPGLTDSERSMISIAASGDDTLTLEFTDKNGNSKSIEWAYDADDIDLETSDATDTQYQYVVVENQTINEYDYFIVDAGDFPHLLQATDITADGTSTASVTLEDVFSGTTYEITLGSDNKATAYIDGQPYYIVGNISGTTTDMKVTWGAGATYGDVGASTTVFPMLEGKNGEKIALVNTVSNIKPGDVLLLPGSDTAITIDGTNTTYTAGAVSYTYNQTSDKLFVTSVGEDNEAVLVLEEKDDASTRNAVIVKAVSNSGTTEKIEADSPTFTDANVKSDTARADSDIKYYVDLYGTFVIEDENGDQDKVTIYYPDDQMVNNFYVMDKDSSVSTTEATTGTEATTTTYESVVPITTSIAKLDTEVTSADKTSKNLILVGGPCVNTLVADLAAAGKVKDGEGVLTCDAWNARTTKFGLIQLIDDAFATGKVALVVAGSTKDETREACSVLQDYANKGLSGTAVKVVNNVISPVTLA